MKSYPSWILELIRSSDNLLLFGGILALALSTYGDYEGCTDPYEYNLTLWNDSTQVHCDLHLAPTYCNLGFNQTINKTFKVNGTLYNSMYYNNSNAVAGDSNYSTPLYCGTEYYCAVYMLNESVDAINVSYYYYIRLISLSYACPGSTTTTSSTTTTAGPTTTTTLENGTSEPSPGMIGEYRGMFKRRSQIQRIHAEVSANETQAAERTQSYANDVIYLLPIMVILFCVYSVSQRNKGN